LADDLTEAMDFDESKKGNPTVMYVGYTKSERMLEVGVEFLENAEHVYHVSCARGYQNLCKSVSAEEKALTMSKMTKKELQQRMTKLKLSARAQLAKTEVMHFRLDADSIEKLYAMAGKKRKPVGALVREWVLERLQTESGEKSKSAMAVSLIEVNQRLQAIEQHLKLV
jgi:hypothetical protein